MSVSRFAVTALAAALAAIGLASSVAAQPVDHHVRVTLVGTGGPEINPTRYGYSTLIEAGGQRLLFDAGRGVVQRLYESRVNPRDVTKIFLTHLHNDHIEGLPTLWITPWFLLARDKPLEVWGPPGTLKMIKGMRAMFSDVEKRGGVNGFNKIEYMDVKTTEITDGQVYDQDGLKVSAFKVSHGDGDPAVGYKIEYGHRVVVLSGDTVYSPNVVTAARGADLLVHNVVGFSDEWMARPEAEKHRAAVASKLASPEQAARAFSESKPRLAVLSHIVKKDLSGKAGDEIIVKQIRQAGYTGPMLMGEDRTVIDIDDDGVKVTPPRPTEKLPDLDNKNVKLDDVQ
ncbi:MBL fold metallo-hydrolase [uncultured Bradyrhizobium sp.]|uniref:MBL fold metallo-hydrolase n=1 Tax=uncultured Bradyrhizobium sp. TaxID=199684 RepID=UPI002638126B|nr:MBL fold metallo-hydrolase [uncultured Bradyrhizobium sp.]